MTTVLVIDDDVLVLHFLDDALTLLGYRVLTARHGAQGLEIFDREAPDVVFCDLAMPGIGGLEVLAEVCRRSPFTPFVVISGTTEVEQAVGALRAGAWDFVTKPLESLENLRPLIQRLMARRADLEARTRDLQRQLDEKDRLLAEVHHRVKNNLQIMLVLLGLQRDRSADPAVQAALDAGRQRIHTLAMVQDEMHDGDHATRVAARSYTEGLVMHLLTAWKLTAQAQLTLNVDETDLSADLAFTLGLVLNELLEALGRVQTPGGPWNLTVALKEEPGDRLVLRVSEDRGLWAAWVPVEGRPCPGWDLIEVLASRHGGRADWSPAAPDTFSVRLK